MKMLSILFWLFPGRKVTGVNWSFVKVVDGDTIAFIDKRQPKPIQKVSIRVLGIDTPESTYRAKSEAEKKHGLAAKQFVYQRIKKARRLHLTIKGWDKYGGRVLGSIKVDGKDIAKLMTQEGYAVYYDGGKKPDWEQILKKQKREPKKQFWLIRLIKKLFS